MFISILVLSPPTTCPTNSLKIVTELSLSNIPQPFCIKPTELLDTHIFGLFVGYDYSTALRGSEHSFSSSQTTNNPWALQIRDTKTHIPAFVNLSQGVELVRSELFALYTEVDEFYLMARDKYSVDERCSLAELPLTQEDIYTAMAVPLLSPYRKFFNYG